MLKPQRGLSRTGAHSREKAWQVLPWGGTMHTHTREFYCSANGDKCFLRHDTENTRVYVKHVGNAASSGHQTDYKIEAFLSRPHSPERTALLQLIASLAGDESDSET